MVPQAAANVPPLASAVVALRSNPSLGALPHVVSSVSQCLDYSVEISLACACAFSSLRLLRRIWDGSKKYAASNGSAPGDRRYLYWSPLHFLQTDCHYHRAQFSRGVVEAVRRGDLDMIRWLFAHFSGCVVAVQAVEAAAASGDLRTLEFFLDNERAFQDAQDGAETNDSNEVQWGGADMAAAVEKGHADVARWLFEQKGDVERDWGRFMAAVVRGGNLELLQWLLDRGYVERQLAPPTMDDAAWGGHLDMLQWLYHHGYVHHASFALEHAARNGYLEIVEWLVRYHPVGNTSRGLDAAARENHLHVVRWLLEHNLGRDAAAKGSRPTDTHDAMDGAAAGNHLEVVKWLSAHRSGGCTTAAMDGAAANGHLEMVQWLHEHRVEGCTTAAMDAAARNGHLDVVKWLHEHRSEGCTTAAMDGAAGSGAFEVLQCRSGIFKAVEAAATKGHLSILEQVLVHDKRGVCIKPAMLAAARGNKLRGS
ncbi:hypothetical protein PC114_g22776 [Phytophthora cactorum]|nr:hypothetical protein PC114_g22776 [Phytophthora cactorum]